MKFMSIEELFLELIQVAIGTRVYLSYAPCEEEWHKLYVMAQKQSLVGVCFYGVQVLVNQQQKPPVRLYNKWLGMTAIIMQKNDVLNKRCAELQDKLSADGVQFCILKGQGAGLRYTPYLSMLRQPGDIDVWMAGGLEEVVRYVNGISHTEEVNNCHVQFHVFDDVEVEVHYVPIKLGNRFANKRLKSWLRTQEYTQMKNTVSFNGGVLNIPTNEFDMVFHLLHIYKHFFNEGIGLRQLMDYCFILQVEKDAQKISDAQMVIHKLGLDCFASALMWVIARVFYPNTLDTWNLKHKTPSWMPWEPNQCDGEFMLGEIMQMGNFGYGDARFRLSKNDSHAKHFWQLCLSKLRFIGHFPMEVFWQPVDILIRFFEHKALRRKLSQLE